MQVRVGDEEELPVGVEAAAEQFAAQVRAARDGVAVERPASAERGALLPEQLEGAGPAEVARELLWVEDEAGSRSVLRMGV